MISYVTVFIMVTLGRLTSSNFPVDRSDWSTLSFTGESVIDLKRLRCNERRKQMFTEDRSLTVRYKLGAVSENEFLSHWNKIKEIYGASLPEKILWHPELFTGYVLPSYVGGEVLNFVRSLPGVESVARSKVYRTTSLSWGLDRIDQTNLPLDGRYSPDFDGTGVDVYVVDSGIDTEHTEFKHVEGKRQRKVKNIFDVSNPSYAAPNNDGVGHGTHVAGIVGGNTVGVSPGCNIYGVKVLASNGGGSDFDIVAGLSFVLQMYSTHKRPSIVSMSLGGTCESYEECAADLLVIAVDLLSSAGIVVVTAAGNSDCDSCLTTPAYAPQGITVGASSITDDAAVFSDFGKCIDIYAPGVEIISACGSAMCPGELNQYKNLSGTSMACPFVSGVVAQLLEGHPTSSVANITTMLSCVASPMVLSIVQDRPPSVTRNLLLKVPKKHLTTTQPSSQPSSAPSEATTSSNPTEPTPSLSPTESSKPSAPAATPSPSSVPSKAKQSSPTAPTATAAPISAKNRFLWGLESEDEDPDMCNLGQGCEQFNFCSNKGICQNGRCLCDALAWGPDCSSVEFGSHCGEGYEFVPYSLYDGLGQSWYGAEFKIRDESNNAMLTTSICEGFFSKSGVCLQPGNRYTLQVTLPPEPVPSLLTKSLNKVDVMARAMGSVGWTMCGESGGVPATMEFMISNTTKSSKLSSFKEVKLAQCTVLCDTNAHFGVTLNAKALTASTPFDIIPPGSTVGWHGGYYSLHDEKTGTIFAGGTLIMGQGRFTTHRICLPPSTVSDTGVKTVVAVLSDGQGDTYRAVSYSERTWSMCGALNPIPLVTDFAFYKIDSKGTCEAVTPNLIPDQNRAPSTKPTVKNIRVGLFSAHTRYDDTFKFNESKWLGMEYAIKQRVVASNNVVIGETYISNGTIPSTTRAVQYEHPLNGMNDWVFLVKKQGHDGPDLLPLPPIYYRPSGIPTGKPLSLPPTLPVPTRKPMKAAPTSPPAPVPSQEPTKAVPTSPPAPVPSQGPTKAVPTSPPAPVPSQGPTKAVPTSTEEPSKPVAAPSQEPSKAAATKRKELAATTALHRGESNTASSFMTALGEFKLPTSVTRIVRQGALHALTVLTIKAAPNHKATSEHPSIKKAKLLADKTDKPTYAPTATIVSSPTPSPTYSPTATSYPTRAVTTQRSPEDPYFMSCGVRGNMDEYYKFHRTGDDMGCERSCSMLTSNKKPSLKLYQKPVNYETDTVLAFITELDEKNTLHSIRRLSERNFVCLGNATSPSAPQSFRMMLGGGTNLADPRWNFCNVAPTSVASIVEFTVHDWTNCTSKVVANFACSEATELPMLFFLYGDKGVGWNGGLYLIMSYPTTASSIIKSLLQPEKDDGFKIVNVGTLAGNKQTGIKDMCISDGCYSTTIAPGNTPDDIFMIMCGGVATPGADVAFEIADGRCTIMPNVLVCRALNVKLDASGFILYLSYTILLCCCCLGGGVGVFCMRTKVYDVKFDAPVVVEARRVGGSNEEFENNPMHFNSAGGGGSGGGKGGGGNGGDGGKGNFDANPFSQQSPSGGGGVEMSPPMPRVFNGDYRQLPVATDSD